MIRVPSLTGLARVLAGLPGTAVPGFHMPPPARLEMHTADCVARTVSPKPGPKSGNYSRLDKVPPLACRSLTDSRGSRPSLPGTAVPGFHLPPLARLISKRTKIPAFPKLASSLCRRLHGCVDIAGRAGTLRAL